MSTPGMWRAMELYDQYYQGFHNTPLVWDSKAQRLRFSTKTKIWQFNVAIIMLPSIVASGALIMRTILEKEKSIQIWKVGFHMMLFFTGVMSTEAAIGQKWFGRELAFAVNSLIEMEQQLMPEKISKNGRRRTKKSKTKRDFLGELLKLYVSFTAIYPIIMALSVVLLDLDVNYILLKDTPVMKTFRKPIIRPYYFMLRIIHAWITFGETSRLFGLLFTLIIMVMKIATAVIEKLVQKTTKVPLLLSILNQGHIFMQAILTCSDMGTGAMMFSGFIMLILSNFATMTMYGLVPLAIFLIAPFVTVFTSAVINMSLPPAINMYENTKDHLEYCKWIKVEGWNMKYTRRKLVSMQPLRVYAGLNGHRVFFLQKSTKSSYYWAILDYTINILLSVSSKHLI